MAVISILISVLFIIFVVKPYFANWPPNEVYQKNDTFFNYDDVKIKTSEEMLALFQNMINEKKYIESKMSEGTRGLLDALAQDALEMQRDDLLAFMNWLQYGDKTVVPRILSMILGLSLKQVFLTLLTATRDARQIIIEIIKEGTPVNTQAAEMMMHEVYELCSLRYAEYCYKRLRRGEAGQILMELRDMEEWRNNGGMEE